MNPATAERDPLEIAIQNSILGHLGAQPGVLLFRNAVDHRNVHYGLGEGSPDIVGWVAPHGRMVGLDVKRPGNKATKTQLDVHAQWRRRGAYVAVVHSVSEAWAAIARAQEMSASKDRWADWGEQLVTPPAGSLVVFDTETTGLHADARIVEIAAVRVEGGRITDRFETLVNPECDIPREASAIHGIHGSHVKDAPLACEALEMFRRFVGLYPLLAHNANYDVRVLRSESVRTHVLLPFVPVFCSVKMAKAVIRPKLKSNKLDVLIQRYSVTRSVGHRAMPDVLALVEVLRGLARELAQREPGVSLRDVHGPAEVLCDLAEGMPASQAASGQSIETTSEKPAENPAQQIAGKPRTKNIKPAAEVAQQGMQWAQ